MDTPKTYLKLLRLKTVDVLLQRKLQSQKNGVIFLPSKSLQFYMRDPEIIAMLSEAILFAREQPLA